MSLYNVGHDSGASQSSTARGGGTLALSPDGRWIVVGYAFGGPQAPSNESWRIMLVVMAGILASVLILTPSPATRRK